MSRNEFIVERGSSAQRAVETLWSWQKGTGELWQNLYLYLRDVHVSLSHSSHGLHYPFGRLVCMVLPTCSGHLRPVCGIIPVWLAKHGRPGILIPVWFWHVRTVSIIISFWTGQGRPVCIRTPAWSCEACLCKNIGLFWTLEACLHHKACLV